MTKELYPEMICIADICLCEYTDHGHCGVIKDGEVLNDETLELFVKGGSQLASAAGTDIVAPSDRMDGESVICAMHWMRPVMQYMIMACVKYASAFYRPIQRGSDSAPAFGDRKSYQMDFRNPREALLETELDVEEGADIYGEKPALAYLDIVITVSETFDLPLCTYSVSGEYAMMSGKEWLTMKARGDGEHDRCYETCQAKMIITVLCTADCRVAAGRRGTEIMRSQKIFEKACELMPGGVNSPVRAYRAVGMTPPPYIHRAKGVTHL